MTDSVRLPDPRAAAQRLVPGSAVILRHYDHPDRLTLARELSKICRRRRILLLIAGDWRLAVAVGADGVHLPEGLARRGPPAWGAAVAKRADFLVTAAAHSLPAIQRAEHAGLNAVLLSPVFATASHPGKKGLGPVRFALWCRKAQIPIYALGGIDSVTFRRLKGGGHAGIAAIGGLAKT